MKPIETAVMKLSDLNPADYNPREISEEALAGLENSMERFGLVQPIIWNRQSGNVVGGHQRLKVLEKKGQTETEVVVVDLCEIDEKALNIALNSHAISGHFTEDLQDLLDDIKLDDFDQFKELRFDVLDNFTSGILGDDDEQGSSPGAGVCLNCGDMANIIEGMVYFVKNKNDFNMEMDTEDVDLFNRAEVAVKNLK